MILKELFLGLRNKVSFQPYYINPNMKIGTLAFQKIGVLTNFLFALPEIFLYRSALTGLRRVKGSKPDRAALLIANGPSSSNLNLSKIKSEIQSGNIELYLINFSILDENYLQLNPNYIVLSDEATRPDIETQRNRQLWDSISSLKKTQVITPMLWHGKFNQLRCEDSSCLHFVDVCLIGWTDNCSPMFPYGYVPLTAYKALSVANYMNYSEILLSGYDNSMFRSISVDLKNRLIEGPNHSSETYRDSNDLTKLFENGIADYFYGLSLSFLSLKKSFGNLQITNLGINSEVDCFPKISNTSKWSYLIND
jgi:hypothetical protein